MNVWLENLPWLVAMALMMGCSAFFSASEAALFSLSRRDRRVLGGGTRSERAAAALLADPDRLLSAVLFWNLVTNMAYFAVASIVGFQLEENSSAGTTQAYVFSAVALLMIIFCSEMLPKTLAVLRAASLAGMIGSLLSLAVRVVDPMMPVLRLINLLSQRVIWPRFHPEPYLEVADLERAIELSTTDADLLDQERKVLSNIVSLSDIRVDEWMRPRTQFLVFRPPVSLSDLEGQRTPSGYLLITQGDSDEVAGAIDLETLTRLPAEHLEQYAIPVTYVPWCTTVADAFQQMRQGRRDVVAVVNEFGETIGILTIEDIMHTVFGDQPSRSERLLDLKPIEQVDDGVWRVTGVTNLRRLARTLELDLPESKNNTVAGAIQEVLQRLPESGDSGHWGPFHFRVLQALGRARLVVELTLVETGGEEDEP